ncbi:MAG: hypothetical protein QM564_08690 [Bergeyella sp.]
MKISYDLKNFNQEIKEQSTGYQGVDNRVYHEYFEVTQKLIALYEKQIAELKEQLDYWK